MIIYEVNISMKNDSISDEFLSWLRVHIAEMEDIEGILPGSEVFQELESKLKISVQYKFSSKEMFDRYINERAQSMRGRLPSHLKEHLVFSRRCLLKLSN